MYEVRVKFQHRLIEGRPHSKAVENRLKSFLTFDEAKRWAENKVRSNFPDSKISIYMDGTLIKTLDSHRAP